MHWKPSRGAACSGSPTIARRLSGAEDASNWADEGAVSGVLTAPQWPLSQLMVAMTGAWSGQTAFLRCDGWSPIEVTCAVSIVISTGRRASSVLTMM